MKHSKILAVAAVLVAVGLASSVQGASTITAKFVDYNGASFSTTLGSGGAGAMRWEYISSSPSSIQDDLVSLDSNDYFRTFCIEFVEHVSYNNTYTYAWVDPALAPEANGSYGAMGPTKAGLLQQWFGAYYDDVVASNWANKESAAFQMGIWEIVYETAASFSLSSDFWTVSSSNSNANTLASTWLADTAWQSASAPKLNLMAMSAPNDGVPGNYQDQITVASIPAPTAAPATAGFLILTGLIGAQRRRARDDSQTVS